jgi:hypothetical protein
MMIFPVDVFSSVPNLSTVNLSSPSNLSFLSSSLSTLSSSSPASTASFLSLLQDVDYHSYRFSAWNTGSSFSSLDWSDYAQLKTTFMMNAVNNHSLNIAIHWWQRSWQ